jgi:hypothetical protein
MLITTRRQTADAPDADNAAWGELWREHHDRISGTRD